MRAKFIRDWKTGTRLAILGETWQCKECRAVLPGVAPGIAAACPKHPQAASELNVTMLPHPADDASGVALKQSQVEGDPRIKLWTKNYEANAPRIAVAPGGSFEGIPTSDVVWIVGAGPSLERQIQDLAQVEVGVKVGANLAARWVPSLDYFVAVDANFKDCDGLPDATAILDVCANPALATKPFKEVRWVTRAGSSPLLDRIRAERPGIFAYYEHWHVMPAIFAFVARVLRPKVVILVGCDCGHTNARRHPFEDLILQGHERYALEVGINNRPVVMDLCMSEIRSTTETLCAFLAMDGVKVINATEGGALPETFPLPIAERKSLADAAKLARAVCER